MKFKAKSVEQCTTLFEIEVSPETISKAFDEVYNDISKVANIPGFRVGKAPKEMVRVRYANDAREEVLKTLIPDSYRRALKEHGVRPVGLPEITDVKFDEDKPLFFKAKVDIRPNFTLKTYKGLKLERKKAVVTDKDVESTINSLREMNAKYDTVEDRAIAMGDYVVSDLECFVGDKEAHKKRENVWLTVEKDSFIPGLTEKMVGMKKGEERDIEVLLPEKYPNKDLAGKKARYHVLAKEIKVRRLPEIDDEFAKDLGKDNLEDLKKEILKELEARAKSNAEAELENDLLKKIIDDNNFDVPSSFVSRQLNYMVEDAKRRLAEKGVAKDELDKRDDDFKKKFKDDAVRQVRLLFILDEIASMENIEPGDKDLSDAYSVIAMESGKSEHEVKSHYEREDLVDSLKEKIREGKTVKFLIDNAVITEK